MFYDYCESGSYTEQTFRENSSRFRRIRLRQRVAVDMTGRTTASTMIGQDVAMPVALAPVGMTGMQHADGEIKAAQAAEKFGVPFTLSTMSICSIEDVAEHTTKPFWFQLYAHADEDFVRRPDRAGAGGEVFGAGPDAGPADPGPAAQGSEERPVGPAAPDAEEPAEHADQAALGAGDAGTQRRIFRNIVGHAKGVGDLTFADELDQGAVRPAARLGQGSRRSATTWGGKFILKGILDEEDAQRAADFGADAIIVSNHGGRQLDGALSSIRMLPASCGPWATRSRSIWTAASGRGRTC